MTVLCRMVPGLEYLRIKYNLPDASHKIVTPGMKEFAEAFHDLFKDRQRMGHGPVGEGHYVGDARSDATGYFRQIFSEYAFFVQPIDTSVDILFGAMRHEGKFYPGFELSTAIGRRGFAGSAVTHGSKLLVNELVEAGIGQHEKYTFGRDQWLPGS